MAIIKSLSILMRVDNSKVRGDMNRTKEEIKKEGRSWGLDLRKVLIGAGIGTGIVSSIKRAMEMEKIDVSFAKLLNSNQAAVELKKSLRGIADEGMFKEMDMFKGAGRFLALGFNAEQTRKVMSQIADISAATGQDMAGVGLVISQIFGKQKFQGEEALQLMERNINLTDELNKVLGTTTQEYLQMRKEGLVTAEHYAKAMELATGEGGKFSKMNEAMGKTAAGTWVRITDQVERLKEVLGRALLPVLEKLVNSVMRDLSSESSVIRTMFKLISYWVTIASKAFSILADVMIGINDLLGGLLGKLSIGAITWVVFGSAAIKIVGIMITVAKAIRDVIKWMVIFKAAFGAKVLLQTLATMAVAGVGVAALFKTLGDEIDASGIGNALSDMENLKNLLGQLEGGNAGFLFEGAGAGGASGGPGGPPKAIMAGSVEDFAFRARASMESQRMEYLRRTAEAAEKIANNGPSAADQGPAAPMRPNWDVWFPTSFGPRGKNFNNGL